MELSQIEDVLSSIQGCTFASLDAETWPRPGIRKETLGERVMLFTNKRSSGYENMVHRRLLAAGKNPDNFVLSDLAWGERVPNTPLITHRGAYYLQTVLIAPGLTRYYFGEREINPVHYGIRHPRTNQGLPVGQEVIVLTYKLESIVRLRILGETFQSAA